MFVHDPPLAVLLAQSHGEAELQLGRNGAWRDVKAVADRGNESHVFARGDLDVVEVEDNWPRLRLVEQFPGVHVCVDSAREEREWNIEHQHVRRMMRADSVKVFSADGGCPA